MAGLLLAGSLGYWGLGRLYASGTLEPKLEAEWSFLDCVYMTVITVSTIGYGETLPLGAGQQLGDFALVRVYTMLVILTGMLLVGYSVSSATAFFVEGDLARLWQRRRAMKDIMKLRGHYIVCGAGVTGLTVTSELAATGRDHVVIDTREDALDHARQLGAAFTLQGDATDDDMLERAGIAHAAGIAAALPDDKDNIFLIISARQLNPSIRIVTVATSSGLTTKLTRAGADSVVAGATIGGMRLASELFRPAVVSFLDLMLRGREVPVRFAQVEVRESWAGKTLSEVDIPGTTGLPVLAAREPDSDEFVFNPPGDYRLQAGTVLVTLGETEKVARLNELSGDTQLHVE